METCWCVILIVFSTPLTHFVDLVSPSAAAAAGIVVPPPVTSSTSGLTEDDERELAELMNELGE